MSFLNKVKRKKDPKDLIDALKIMSDQHRNFLTFMAVLVAIALAIPAVKNYRASDQVDDLIKETSKQITEEKELLKGEIKRLSQDAEDTLKQFKKSNAIDHIDIKPPQGDYMLSRLSIKMDRYGYIAVYLNHLFSVISSGPGIAELYGGHIIVSNSTYNLIEESKKTEEAKEMASYEFEEGYFFNFEPFKQLYPNLPLTTSHSITTRFRDCETALEFSRKLAGLHTEKKSKITFTPSISKVKTDVSPVTLNVKYIFPYGEKEFMRICKEFKKPNHE